MRNTSVIWEEFMDVLQSEIENIQVEILDTYLLDFFLYKDKTASDQILPLPDIYGYPIDLTILSDLDFIKREIESMSFRKKFKTTYKGYYYIFNALAEIGEVIPFQYDAGLDKGFRIPSDDNWTYIETLDDYSLPILFTPEKDLSSFLPEELLTYDSGETYDSTGETYYDATSLLTNTHHIAFELFADSVYTEDSVDYLALNDYFSYFRNLVNYNRRGVEVPHIGIQISSINDSSGLYDNYFSSGNDYTIPSIKLRSALKGISYVNNIPNITKIKIGSGNQDIPGLLNGVTVFPTDLQAPVYEKPLYPLYEVEITDNWYVIHTTIGIENQKEVFTNLSISSLSETLVQTPIQKKSIKLHYVISGIEYTALDDGLGNISGLKVNSGTIDYTTGAISVSFSESTDATEDVYVDYSFNSFCKDNAEEFALTEITEAGIFDNNDEMIYYATFPKVKYNDNYFHISFQFYVKKEPYELLTFIGGDSTTSYPDTIFGGDSTTSYPDTIKGV
jgi:hypothetical protein